MTTTLGLSVVSREMTRVKTRRDLGWSSEVSGTVRIGPHDVGTWELGHPHHAHALSKVGHSMAPPPPPFIAKLYSCFVERKKHREPLDALDALPRKKQVAPPLQTLFLLPASLLLASLPYRDAGLWDYYWMYKQTKNKQTNARYSCCFCWRLKVLVSLYRDMPNPRIIRDLHYPHRHSEYFEEVNKVI